MTRETPLSMFSICVCVWVHGSVCSHVFRDVACRSDWMRVRLGERPVSESWLCIYLFFYRIFASELTAFFWAVQTHLDRHHENVDVNFWWKKNSVHFSLSSCLQICLTHMLPNVVVLFLMWAGLKHCVGLILLSYVRTDFREIQGCFWKIYITDTVLYLIRNYYIQATITAETTLRKYYVLNFSA